MDYIGNYIHKENGSIIHVTDFYEKTRTVMYIEDGSSVHKAMTTSTLNRDYIFIDEGSSDDNK